MSHKKPIALVILDGFGYSKDATNNAIAQSNMPHYNAWLNRFPHTLLAASGPSVGLFDDMIGNSEVGHITIGAGRIVKQPVTIIHESIADGSFFTNPILTKKLAFIKQSGKPLHIMGLLSDAGIHSHEELLYALIKAAVAAGITNIIIHPFLDGRDVLPKSAGFYLQKLEDYLDKIGHGIIGSVHGRYYAMDRDAHWDRTQVSYRAMTQLHKSSHYPTWQELLKKSYEQQITALRQAQDDRDRNLPTTDEFIIPTQLSPKAVIEEGSSIIFFNIRPDRARQLTAAFIEPDFHAFPVKNLHLTCFVTPISYGTKYHTDVLFKIPDIMHTLKDILAQHDKTILSIAETEKYAHVTYFFAGGKETIFHNEIRILIPSMTVKSFADCPQMSASLITQSVLKSLKKSPKDFYLINYANADMVGHSGNLQATIKAVEYLDQQLQLLYQMIVEHMDGILYITADHGKAEKMFDATHHQPNTAHTNNKVPFLLLQKHIDPHMTLPLHQLSDIAPWILEHMGLPIPEEMKQ